MTELAIRWAEAEDVPTILDVLRASLGETPLLRRTVALWDWKHIHNPFGRSLVLVAELGGRIVGVRAMMRWQLNSPDGDTLECLRPVDTATHPEFARRGVFKELTMAVLEEARAQGFHLIFNTPNEKSAPGYLGMGWKHVSRIGVLIRPKLVGRAAKPHPGSIPTIESLCPGLPSGDGFPFDFSDRSPSGLRTPRRRDYLEWRFGDHPTAQYGWMDTGQESGAIVRASTRKGRSEVVVSDLLGSPTPGVVRDVAKQSRARYLAGWFSPGSPERTTAIRGGMLPAPGVFPLQLVALPLAKLDIDVFDLGSWDMATSDLELL